MEVSEVIRDERRGFLCGLVWEGELGENAQTELASGSAGLG